MPAVQVNTISAVLVPGTNVTYETVMVQNLGPNLIALDLAGVAGTASGWQVLPGASVTFRRPPLTAVLAIAATLLQVSPADTRWMVTV